MSRMLFTPAQTTHTGVVDSSVRSALTSNDVAAPRCTPPSPPVTKTRIPAREASRMVAATVVAPCPWRAMIDGRSRTLAFTTDGSLASSSRSSGDSPTCGTPPSTAMVAGTAPCSRTMPSTSVAIATFCGYGMPWLMIVLSSATTGRPAATASATSSVSCDHGDILVAQVGDDGVRAGHGECGRLVAVRRGVGQRRPLQQPVAERRQHRVAGPGHVHRRRGRRLELHHRRRRC